MLNYFYSLRKEKHYQIDDTFRSKEFAKVQTFDPEPVPLTEEEIEKIKTFDFAKAKAKEHKELEQKFAKGELDARLKTIQFDNLDDRFKKLEVTRTRMMLQIYTGLRVSDLFNIKKDNVKSNKIVMRLKKTIDAKSNNRVTIPLFKTSKQILADHGNESVMLKTSPQNYNYAIKDLLKIVGIDTIVEIVERKGLGGGVTRHLPKHEVFTSHNLRDTFITRSVVKKIPISSILKATGQSKYEIMKRYVGLLDDDVVDHYEGFE